MAALINAEDLGDDAGLQQLRSAIEAATRESAAMAERAAGGQGLVGTGGRVEGSWQTRCQIEFRMSP